MINQSRGQSYQEAIEERILEDLSRPGPIYFSTRLRIDDYFERYCKITSTQYCILNFLAFLQTHPVGKLVVGKLSQEGKT